MKKLALVLTFILVVFLVSCKSEVNINKFNVYDEIDTLGILDKYPLYDDSINEFTINETYYPTIDNTSTESSYATFNIDVNKEECYLVFCYQIYENDILIDENSTLVEIVLYSDEYYVYSEYGFAPYKEIISTFGNCMEIADIYKLIGFEYHGGDYTGGGGNSTSSYGYANGGSSYYNTCMYVGGDYTGGGVNSTSSCGYAYVGSSYYNTFKYVGGLLAIGATISVGSSSAINDIKSHGPRITISTSSNSSSSETNNNSKAISTVSFDDVFNHTDELEQKLKDLANELGITENELKKIIKTYLCLMLGIECVEDLDKIKNKVICIGRDLDYYRNDMTFPASADYAQVAKTQDALSFYNSQYNKFVNDLSKDYAGKGNDIMGCINDYLIHYCAINYWTFILVTNPYHYMKEHRKEANLNFGGNYYAEEIAIIRNTYNYNHFACGITWSTIPCPGYNKEDYFQAANYKVTRRS